MSENATAVDEWLSLGRKTVEGYLLVVRGQIKRRSSSLFDRLIASAIEEHNPGTFPHYPDCHAVWFGYDESKEPGHRHVRPFLRYRATRPIGGLRRECNGHRVRLTCRITERWSNGLGAYITHASGECLECDPS